MRRILLKKIEVWVVVLAILIAIPLSAYWGMKIVSDNAFPWEIINEISLFVKGHEDENSTLWAKTKSLFGYVDRFVVESFPERPDNQEFATQITHETFGYSTSMTEGFYLFYGIMSLEGDAQPTAILMDTQGQIVRKWVFPFKTKSNSLKRLAYSPNGVLVSNASAFLRAQNWCGEDLWRASGWGYHHEMEYSDEQFILWWNDAIVSVNENSGVVTELIDMKSIVLANPDVPQLRSTLDWFTYGEENERLVFDNKQKWRQDTDEMEEIFLGDNFHQNKVAVNYGISKHFPAGSMLISMRQIDLVAVIDPNSGKVLWYDTFDRQHDPEWTENGIIVYNNRSHFRNTRIEYVGFDGEREILVGEKQLHWYRKFSGNFQQYPDDSIVFQGGWGEIFHISSEGVILTQFKSKLQMRNGYYLTTREVEKLEQQCNLP